MYHAKGFAVFHNTTHFFIISPCKLMWFSTMFPIATAKRRLVLPLPMHDLLLTLDLMCRPLIPTTCIHQSNTNNVHPPTRNTSIDMVMFFGAAMLHESDECERMNPFSVFVKKRTWCMGCRKSLRKAVDLFSLDLVSIAARQMNRDMDAGSEVVAPSMEVFRSRDLDLFQLDPSESQQRNQ